MSGRLGGGGGGGGEGERELIARCLIRFCPHIAQSVLVLCQGHYLEDGLLLGWPALLMTGSLV